MRFDLHIHTIYSKHWFWGYDSLVSPKAAVKIALKRNLAGMAITDHNNVKGSLVVKALAKDIDKDFIIITGAEVSSASGHILALGIEEDIKRGLSVEETVEEIRARGGVAIASHPFAKFLFRKCVEEKAIKADAIEVLNASSCTELQNKKAALLAARYNKPGVASSDSHSLKTIGIAGIECEGDPLSAIKKGQFKIFGRRAPSSNFPYVVGNKVCRYVSKLLKAKMLCSSQHKQSQHI